MRVSDRGYDGNERSANSQNGFGKYLVIDRISFATCSGSQEDSIEGKSRRTRYWETKLFWDSPAEEKDESVEENVGEAGDGDDDDKGNLGNEEVEGEEGEDVGEEEDGRDAGGGNEDGDGDEYDDVRVGIN